MSEVDPLPLVSIIIPSYNTERYIAQALDSALSQTYPYVEIVVVDDGSTDRSPAILGEYAVRYPDRITVIHQTNQGVGEARMTALAHVHGTFFLPLDGDDWLAPEAVTELVAYQRANPQFAVVYSLWYLTDEAGQVQGITPMMEDRRGEPLEGAILPTILVKNATLATMLIQTEAGLKAGGYLLAKDGAFIRITPDYLMNLNLLLAGYQFGFIARPLLYYRDTPNSLSKDSNLTQRNIAGIVAELTQRHPDQMASAWYWGILAREAHHLANWHTQQALSSEREQKLADLDNQLKALDAHLYEREAHLAELARQLQERDAQAQEREARLAELDSRLRALVNDK